ncbi:hypothetical protein EFW17_05530 [Halostreptopolyspora alba]|uniref:Integrase catalytic domain-containing protein n=1 Tax=Halostreptopolyspora alba TaxID=2487137 RepID=A0A3N0EDS0_9ACTN|nr:hypothetical protein EFW17_05530 [Nocardiopsaceae bacterium YIM 96095]
MLPGGDRWRQHRGRLSPSIGHAGSCFGNAVTENLLASWDTELIERPLFTTHADAEREVFSFVERLHNLHRCRSPNRQPSPAEHEHPHTVPAFRGNLRRCPEPRETQDHGRPPNGGDFKAVAPASYARVSSSTRAR